MISNSTNNLKLKKTQKQLHQITVIAVGKDQLANPNKHGQSTN